jgi:hypothetical protein
MEVKLSELNHLTGGLSANSLVPILQNGYNYITPVSSFIVNSPVLSVSGKTGAITLSASDIQTPYITIQTLFPIVTTLSSTNNQTVSSNNVYFDETFFITPVGSLSALTWKLPLSSECRVGQIKTFLSTQNITTFSVSGCKIGAALTTAYANEAYSYQCILPNGTFLRLA